jgi:hypothetical protein
MAEIYMTLAAIGCVGVVWFFVLRPALEDWGIIAPRGEDVSSVPAHRPLEIMSSAPIAAPSLPVGPRTDAPADGRTEEQAPLPRPATLDTVKALRGHGFTRDEARALLKTLGWTLGNDTWARAQPTEDDEIVTPYAGRVTKREYYPDEPALRYRDLEA